MLIVRDNEERNKERWCIIAGNHEGGLKAREKNLAIDPDFYKKIGRAGGLISRGGFAAMDKEKVREAGRKGGLAPKKRPVKPDSAYEQIKQAAEKRKRRWLIF